jgi:hypothetical protein
MTNKEESDREILSNVPCQTDLKNYVGREELCGMCEAYCKNSKAMKEFIEKFDNRGLYR